MASLKPGRQMIIFQAIVKCSQHSLFGETTAWLPSITMQLTVDRALDEPDSTAYLQLVLPMFELVLSTLLLAWFLAREPSHTSL